MPADNRPAKAGPSVTDQEALDFHAQGRPGKIEINATKPMATQRDLSLAYSPGVAVPVKAIADNPSKAFDYTTRGNLVAVISNGPALRGLGNAGALGRALVHSIRPHPAVVTHHHVGPRRPKATHQSSHERGMSGGVPLRGKQAQHIGLDEDLFPFQAREPRLQPQVRDHAIQGRLQTLIFRVRHQHLGIFKGGLG
jgi:hypothetical protein